MNKIAQAAMGGILAAALLAAGALLAAYYALPQAGWAAAAQHLPPQLPGILAFGAAISAFVLIAMYRPPAVGRISERSPLNKEPVKPFIAMFREPEEPLTVLPRPDVAVSETLVRLGDLLKDPEKHADKKILLVLKGAKKGILNPVVLKEIFEKLKALKGFYHVLLMSESDAFIGYIPREAALKDFTGEHAETKISKCIVEVLADPAKSTRLRAMKGAARDDTIVETADIRDAAKKLWFDDAKGELRMDDSVQGLVVLRHQKPIGFLDKPTILTLMSTGA